MKSHKLTEANPAGDELVRTDSQIRQIEADNIKAALRITEGKIAGAGGAAELLGMKPTTLSSRIKALGIHMPSRRSPEVQ